MEPHIHHNIIDMGAEHLPMLAQAIIVFGCVVVICVAVGVLAILLTDIELPHDDTE